MVRVKSSEAVDALADPLKSVYMCIFDGVVYCLKQRQMPWLAEDRHQIVACDVAAVGEAQSPQMLTVVKERLRSLVSHLKTWGEIDRRPVQMAYGHLGGLHVRLVFAINR